MVNVLLFLGGLAILLVSSHQVFLLFRDGSFRARGNRLIVRKAHPTGRGLRGDRRGVKDARPNGCRLEPRPRPTRH